MNPPKRMNAPRRMNAPEDPSMFPHTVTLVTTRTEVGDRYEDITTNYVTYLRGVLCDDSKAANVRKSGLEGADAVNLYIPFDVEAVDAATGEPKQFIGPVEFWRLEGKSGYWTLLPGQSTWFVKGEVVFDPAWPPEAVYSLANAMYDGVYNVTKVDEKDFGGLRHWEVGAA